MTGQLDMFGEPLFPEDFDRALTLWQPWAGVVAAGLKLIENRPWCAPGWIRGRRIWLHAGRRYDKPSAVAITEALRDDEFMPPLAEVMGAILGSTRVVGCVHHFEQVPAGQGRWWSGPHAWVLEDTVALTAPVACRGHQKLWRVPDEVRRVLPNLQTHGDGR